jgi:hypothetical protein
MAAIGFIDPLDDLFPALMLEVHIDIGRLLALARDEALEEQLMLDGIDRGDAQQIADAAVGGAAAPWQRMPRRRLSATMELTVRK